MPAAIDLYCGAGGLSCGFERAGIDAVGAFDGDEVAIETYNSNRLDDHGHVADLAALAPRDASEKYDLPETVDILAGGPPCQGFSLMGRRDPDDTRSNHVHRFFDWVEHFEPEMFLIENVPALKSMDDGEVLDDILQVGRELGYDVQYQVLNAGYYDIPQSRERIFIVGSRAGRFEVPEPVSDRPLSVKHELESISEIDPAWPGEENAGWTPNHDPANPRDATIEKYKNTEFGRDVYGDYATQCRLDPDEPARTIIASNAHWHPYICRPLTIREQAFLQSFDGLYEFRGTKTEQQRQVGNAVPPRLAMHLGKSLVKCLSRDATASGQASLMAFVGD